jgi:competence protein ComFC
MSKLIKDLKFYSKKDIAEDFWNYLSEIFFENEIYKNTDDYIIIFPRMWFFKKLKRWYNHSEILAKYISKNTRIKLAKWYIKKIKTTRQQSLLSRQDRLINLNNSFKIADNKIDKIDKKVFIIVDDVISTWSTINEISKILKENWAKKVIWLIVASD